jgi:hypothetical protein
LFSNTFNPCSTLNMRDCITYLHIRNTRQHYRFISFNFHVYRYKVGREIILNYMVVSIP